MLVITRHPITQQLQLRQTLEDSDAPRGMDESTLLTLQLIQTQYGFLVGRGETLDGLNMAQRIVHTFGAGPQRDELLRAMSHVDAGVENFLMNAAPDVLDHATEAGPQP